MAVETDRRKIVGRLESEGWVGKNGGKHDVFTHPAKRGRIVIPRHKELSMGVARSIARDAGWV